MAYQLAPAELCVVDGSSGRVLELAADSNLTARFVVKLDYGGSNQR